MPVRAIFVAFGCEDRKTACHASCLRDGNDDVTSIVVALEPAAPAEIAPLIVAAYDLTRREEEITRLVARGLGTSDIAAALFVSAS